MRRVIVFLFASLSFATGASIAIAQSTSSSLELQLVKVAPKDTVCAAWFRFQNKLGTDITEAVFEIFTIDSSDSIEGPLNFQLGAVKSGKARIVPFALPLPCDKIKRLHWNGFNICKGDKDYAKECNDAAEISSNATIPFGDDAQ